MIDGLLDASRLAAVGRASVALGGVPMSMDAVAGAAASVAGAPIGVVSLVDGEWDRLLGLHGVGGVFELTRRIAVADSLCRHVVSSGEPVWITDAATDLRTAGVAMVSYLGIGAFAAVPLRGVNDEVVGSVCAIDLVAREWTPQQQAALAGIAVTTSLLPGVDGVASELTVNLLDLVPLLDSLAEGFVAVDTDGAILAWNAGATAMFGWTRDQALGRTLHELLFPDRDAVTIRAILATLAALPTDRHSRPRRQTMWAWTREGRQIPIDATIRALPGAAGPRICASMLDVSAQLNAEADAKLREGFLQAALDSLDTPVFACDAEGRPLLANPALRGFVDDPTASLDEIVDELRALMVGPNGRPLASRDQPSARALAGEQVRDVEVHLAASTRAARFYLVNAEPILVNGKLHGAVVALHDVTENRRAQQYRDGELRISRILLRADSVEEVPRRVVETISASVYGARARLWWVDPDPEVLRLLASSCEPESGVPSLARGEGLAGATWAADQPRWAGDQKDEVGAAGSHRYRGRAALAVPVRSPGSVLGVLSLHADGPSDDPAALAAYLTHIAADLALYFDAHPPGRRYGTTDERQWK